jgi:hypothetical protein
VSLPGASPTDVATESSSPPSPVNKFVDAAVSIHMTVEVDAPSLAVDDGMIYTHHKLVVL